jgi:putative DNA primase/helicase
LQPWLVDAADRLDAPLEMVAIPAHVMLGGLIGRRLGLCPKRYDDWVVVANVWGAIITRPGFLKSPAMHEAKRHLDRLAAAATAAHETRAATVEVERAIIETAIKKLKNEATRREADPESLRTKLAELQQRLSAAVAIPTRFYTNDSTVEKLGVLLNENPTGLLLLRDELAGWLRTLDKPGREGDREFFLEAWNGVGRYCVDRIGRGSIDIPALTIGICGTMQPGKLQAYVAEALDEGRGADGLLQRFQLLVWPDFDGEWHNVDRPPDLAARARAWRVFEAVATLSAGIPGSTDIPTIRFAPDAQELFDAWRGELEARLRSDEFTDCPAYESHVAKYRSLMPALALIRHVADTVDAAAGGSVSFVSGSVGLTAAQNAAALIDFFDEHARRVYAPELHQQRSPHALLAAKIKIGAVRDGDPIRDIGRHGWTGLKTAEAVEHACATLAPLGWVRIEESPRAVQGGRPSRVLRLHPTLRGAVA